MRYSAKFRKMGQVSSIFAGLFLTGQTLWADVGLSQQKLSQEALFHRCYAHLTRSRALPNNALLAAVKAGQKTAVGACMELLAKATLTANGQIASPSDTEAQAVLQNFFDFHYSWFSVKDLASKPISYSSGELRHLDVSEGALELTRLLFEPGHHYDEVVTTTQPVRGIRSLGPWVTILDTGYRGEIGLSVPQTGLDRGTLTGIMGYAPSMNGTWLTDTGTAISNILFNGTRPTNSLRAFGGGVMGFISYVHANSGFPGAGQGDNADESKSTVSNASIRMHRRWSRNVMSDLMCRDLPTLRTADVNTMVEEYTTAFPDPATHLPFRENTACMSCHATVDPMAAVIRNFIFVQDKGYDWNGNGVVETTGNVTKDRTAWVTMIIPDQPAETKEYHLLHRDSAFFRRPPSGYLRYRSYDGTLIQDKISGSRATDALQNLGRAIASKNDIYVCAASRYFQYFTGIKTLLYDEGDPRNPPMSPADQYYRDKVIDLGLRLKSHQSLSTLVGDILSSDIYQKSGMRDLEP